MSETDKPPVFVEIWTDGSCKKNPGPGGYGAYFLCKGKTSSIFGGHSHVTNNQMEMFAAITALEHLKYPCHVKIYSDSQYVINGITQWIHGWVKKGWQTVDGPVKNRWLWKRLMKAKNRHIKVEWQWVRGHAGNKFNEEADGLANQGTTGIIKGELSDCDVFMGQEEDENSDYLLFS